MLPEAIKSEIYDLIVKIIEEYNKNNEKTNMVSEINEPISFKDFCEKYMLVDYNTVKLKYNQVKMFHSVENCNHTIINKYRQAGSTLFLLYYSFYKCLIKSNCKILLCGLYNNSDIFNEISRINFNKIRINGDSKIAFKNGSTITLKRINNLKEDNLISKKYDIIILDELFDFTNINLNFIIPTLNVNGKCIIVSTPKKDSYFNKLAVDAFNKINSFKYIKLNWFEDENFNKDLKIDINGEHQNEFINKKKKLLGYNFIDEEIFGKVFLTEK